MISYSLLEGVIIYSFERHQAINELENT